MNRLKFAIQKITKGQGSSTDTVTDSANTTVYRSSKHRNKYAAEISTMRRTKRYTYICATIILLKVNNWYPKCCYFVRIKITEQPGFKFRKRKMSSPLGEDLEFSYRKIFMFENFIYYHQLSTNSNAVEFLNKIKLHK
jgi:hypothetical protein